MQEVQYTVETLHQKPYVKLLVAHSFKDVVAPRHNDDLSASIHTLHLSLPHASIFLYLPTCGAVCFSSCAIYCMYTFEQPDDLSEGHSTLRQ